MSIDKNIFLVKNLYNYEKVISPPTNLPNNFVTVYLTDNDTNYELAINLGWEIVKKTEEFLDIDDKFERRKIISYINSFPHKLVSEVLDYNFVFICDSNIITLWDEYVNFTNKCSSEYALFVTSGYYSGSRDTIINERDVSANMGRWSYNHNEIINSSNDYIQKLNDNNVDITKLSIVSAKYIGWNLKHEKYNFLSEMLYSEGCKHIQGNIILTYMSGLYPNIIYNYRSNNYNGGHLNSHNYSA
jgi:hypothetical protein